MNPRSANSPAGILSIVFLGLAAGSFYWATIFRMEAFYGVAVVLALVGLLTPLSLQMANQWEKAVVLRLGKLHGIKGPGVFFIVPFVDSVTVWIDQRIQTTEFNAEQALTRDTVPTNIDAILFWQVYDAQRAALEITDYRQAIGRVAQTSLREMIGSSPLTTLLSDRKNADQLLKEEIGRKTADWGVSVISVEIRDVAIPAALQDAMSRQAQAEREKEARVILGAAELAVAQKFLDAANIYAQNPAALQLRAMNIIYETTKERGATILIPTMMVDSMNAGGIMSLAAMANKEITDPGQPAPWGQRDSKK
ncbi:MAG: slipin family protein [Rhodospirillales bacterium]|nr:slipin family protein [Rhodospirillales bacterium]